MTNEEFQKIVLEELKNIKMGQEEIRNELKAVVDQTVHLTEFRHEINQKVDKLIEEFRHKGTVLLCRFFYLTKGTVHMVSFYFTAVF